MWCSRALGVFLQITKARNNLAQSYRLVVVVEKRDRERERHVSARLRGEETEGNSVTTAPNALKSLTLLPLCVIWLTICLVIFALSFWLVVVYLRRTVPERRLVVGEKKKVVSLGPESPSQKERHHPRGGPGTPSPSLPLSLSLHERSGPGPPCPRSGRGLFALTTASGGPCLACSPAG